VGDDTANSALDDTPGRHEDAGGGIDSPRPGHEPPLAYEVFTRQPSEVVIGIVGPLGTDNDKVRRFIADRLAAYGYAIEVVRVSEVIIPGLVDPATIPSQPGFKRSEALIEAGNRIRKTLRNPAALALGAAVEIAHRRPPGEVRKWAYIVSSLKLPQEVAELRKIYAGGFYLLAVHTDRAQRVRNLCDGGEMTEAEAVALITRDEHEPSEYGQHTRDTFALADFFCADEANDDKLRHSINRCLDLVFADPTITPTFNEFAMFMAFAASLRSADLSRQVGAVVARDGEILSTGANDCPKAGGGLYWPLFIGDRVDDLPRGRDFKRGFDSNTAERHRLVNEIAARLAPESPGATKRVLLESGLSDITEYGRAVHAEMEALLACSRGSVSCRGATLFCTTFPCHNCAKHIIAAGIGDVVYVEPYPKSKALDFHDDAVTQDKCEQGDVKVRFKPFIGVGPRQFFDLFSMSLSSGRTMQRKLDSGAAASWDPAQAVPRVQMLPVAHRDFEKAATEYLRKFNYAQERRHERANDDISG
jgi:deoxycytidylate deaminase